MELMGSSAQHSSTGLTLLAFDTSTELMSVAVQRTLDGDCRIWQHSGPGGAQTSRHLIPVIQELMAQADLQFAQLDAIVFGNGPGSFTGLRTACSVAQGLAFGASLKVLPINTLLAVAEDARFQCMPAQARVAVLALLDARMDELYAGRYEFQSGQWTRLGDEELVRPEGVVCETACLLAGNVFTAYGARLPASPAPRIDALPTAAAMLRLAPGLIAAGAALSAQHALPRYIRDKVAHTTEERAAQRAAL
jgi:tRNA threonylcarbamoyladenosine biosynthesis protein TsaB